MEETIKKESAWDDLRIISLLGIIITLVFVAIVPLGSDMIAVALFWNTFCSIAIIYNADQQKVNVKSILAIGIFLGFPVAALATIIKQLKN